MVGFILPFGITYIFLLAFIMFAFLSIVVFLEYRGLNQAHAAKGKKVAESEYQEKFPMVQKSYFLYLNLCSSSVDHI